MIYLVSLPYLWTAYTRGGLTGGNGRDASRSLRVRVCARVGELLD
jgi:hypothetical protein